MKRGGILLGIGLFLLCAGGALVADPSFWGLLNMQYGAAHYGLIEADGVTRAVIHGPKGPWPAWAPTPEGAPVRPVVSYTAAPGHPAQGFGDAPIKTSSEASLRALKAALTADGWSLEESRLDTVEPTLPPRPLVICTLTARRGDPAERTLLYVFQMQPPAPSARIHWFEGAPPAAADHPIKDCSQSR